MTPRSQKTGVCLECDTIRNTQRYHDGRMKRYKPTREHVILDMEYTKRRLINKPVSRLLYGARRNARRLEVECSISEEDIIIPEHCPVFGMKLENRGYLGSRDNVMSLDRIDNSKGYVKGNVQVISFRANRMKSDMSIEELEKFCRFFSKPDHAVDKGDE